MIRPRTVKKASWWCPGALVAMLLLGCAAPQPLMPAERLTALSPQGFAAAEYDLRTRRGVLGQATVWSHGVERVRFEGRRRALVHVGMIVRNESSVPLVIDASALRLDSMLADGTVFEDGRVARVDGSTRVDPGSEARLHMYFAMTPGVYPTDVRQLRLRWALRDNGTIYTQRTPFVRPPLVRGPRTRARTYWGPRYPRYWGPRYRGYWGPRRW
jgi:hypothetical protein